ncbi:MAG: thiamine pyrophosphate-dependent enzyme, partial [Nannocystaceae bacterium]
IMGKNASEVFSEFQKADPWDSLGSGDVKYHMGYYRNYTTEVGREMYLALAFNPSHLEAISPVVQGRVRAKQDTFDSVEAARSAVMGVTLHGDAAFAGQGVVQETLNLMALRGYNTGGSIRLVINNQVGFTTNPNDSRSTRYATDVAHMLQVPIFHINGDDVEAAAYVARLAVAFRQRFKRDVIIDLNCYRKYGHNEGDDPTFTQPEMYRLIKQHPSVLTQYRKTLLERGIVDEADCEALTKRWSKKFDSALAEAREAGGSTGRRPMHGIWESYRGGLESETPDVPTNISQETVDKLATVLCTPPETFNIHRKVKRLLGDSAKMYKGEVPLSWAACELLTYSSLLESGVRLRFSGQDSQRGTFSHRHAVWFDAETGEGYSPLDHLNENQGRFEIFNSPLSEYAVLGFEFGYSLIAPDALVLWEAQFGDFANGAQIIIDNFLSSSEDKWNRLSGLVMMLPHGFEGQGPEHSSARLERFL